MVNLTHLLKSHLNKNIRILFPLYSNMKGKKLGLVGKIILGAGAIASLFSGNANAGESKVYNWSDHVGVANCEKVLITEDFLSNGDYLSLPGNTITRMYGWGPTIGNPSNHKLSDISVEVNKAYLNKLFLTADALVPNGADNYLKIKKNTINPLSFEKRNFFMKRDVNSPSSANDPNVYDVLDLTNYSTIDGRINLPNITSSTPRGTDNPYDIWDHIISNYADIHPSVIDGNLPDGEVNFRDFAVLSNNWGRTDCNSINHWCNYSDLDRDGIVNGMDLGNFSEQWLVDANSIR
jgi:hypothetical protein